MARSSERSVAHQARAIAAPEQVGYVAAAIAENAYRDCMIGKGWLAR